MLVIREKEIEIVPEVNSNTTTQRHSQENINNKKIPR
jgi:hypothetical protein